MDKGIKSNETNLKRNEIFYLSLIYTGILSIIAQFLKANLYRQKNTGLQIATKKFYSYSNVGHSHSYETLKLEK